MIVYHAAKTIEAVYRIFDEMLIRQGRNINGDVLTHVSLSPFQAGKFALDVIGADTNQAWIFELEIPDDTPLQTDPSGDAENYGEGWKVSVNPILILKIHSITHIPHVVEWECKSNGEGSLPVNLMDLLAESEL